MAPDFSGIDPQESWARVRELDAPPRLRRALASVVERLGALVAATDEATASPPDFPWSALRKLRLTPDAGPVKPVERHGAPRAVNGA